jgi:DNA-binding transcriptional MerR regulator
VNQAKKTDPGTDKGEQQLWPMGAVTRRTGIGEHTLRAWERRFGFPAPHRLESGHRRYPADQVQQLLLVNAALNCGYRAGDVVPLDKAELEELLRACGALDAGVPTGITAAIIADTLDACRRFDREALSAALARDASLLGVGPFLRERVSPLLAEIGEAWTRGEIEVRHEHFFSEVLEDQLRAHRARIEASTSGRPVVLATLPDEFHGLGLHIAALAVAAAGRSVRVLGPHLPVNEIAQAADVLDASAVGISVSVFCASAQTADEIATLRDGMSSRTELWVGGAGAAHLKGLPDGVEILATLDDLDAALARV